MHILGSVDKPTAGKVMVEGKDISTLTPAQAAVFRRRKVGLVYQFYNLIPTLTVRKNILMPLILDKRKANPEYFEQIVNSLGIADKLEVLPYQLSGGQQQRAALARSLIYRPALLLADEPTTALDVTIQAQILQLLRELKDEYGMAMVLVTHNLGVAAQIWDGIAVMYGGHIMELGPTRELFAHPQNPYTRGLLASLPVNKRKGEPLSAIPGTPPNLGEMPVGCPFAPRCARAQDVCFSQPPAEREVGPGHTCRCHFADGPCREEDDCGKPQ